MKKKEYTEPRTTAIRLTVGHHLLADSPNNPDSHYDDLEDFEDDFTKERWGI